MIKIENLTYYYPNATTPALDNINLEIEDGEFILFVGPSGCGKSTLVQCLNGIIPKVAGGDLQGKIRIGGKDISSCKVYQLSRHVGMVFQNPNTQLFGLTVEEDVAFGPENLGMAREEIQKLVEKSVGIVGIEKLRKRFTFTLSGGEKQRTAIAGTLSMEPKILVLDEPTSDLDPVGTKQVLETVKRLNKDRAITIILIEHKIDEVFCLADRTIVMDRGRIILDGKTCDVFTRNLDLLESIGIYPPQLIRLSKMLGVKPSLKEMYSYLNGLNGSFKEFSEENPTKKSSTGVVFKDVWFSYRSETPALKGIDLEIKKGEFIALIGSNGSGKTTLLGCLIGFIKPSRGRILIDGQDIKNLSVAELAVKVGYLFQNPDLQLFMNTVAQEVGFGLKNRSLAAADINKNVAQALEIMELSEYRDRHPHSLSRGQRQRLAVASIISMEQDILVLDEPTSGQDRGHLNKFLCQIKKLNDAGKTIIMITHDMNIVAEYARRTVVMDEGKILMDGSTREVFSRPEILKKASIEPPLLARISNDLKNAGRKIPVMLTLEELQYSLEIET
ncbi:MAG: energy-coupling factor transporter ATPase [Candidatus Methanoperedenaceae archaeon]|nr:energy-coupling factor transporter ATPase [Candidatus Methanoperedenaceae archaeon]